MNSYAIDIGKRITKARKAAGLTSADLGISMGVSCSMVSQWECAKKYPTLPTLKRIADACGTTVAMLIPPELLGGLEVVSSLTDYQTQVEATMPGAEDMMPSELETRALHGLGAEVGDIYRLYQRVYTHGEYADAEDLKKKVGDLMRCIAEYCIACDWSLEEICRDSLNRKEGAI